MTTLQPRTGRLCAVAPQFSEHFPDRRASEFFLSRELTWLAFNRRVLDEARKPDTPILERVKFLGIVASNLDEFFMKRIGGLKQQVAAGLDRQGVDGRTPRQQIADCVAEVRDLSSEVSTVFASVRGDLSRHGIRLLDYEQLTAQDRAELRAGYAREVLPLMTPFGFDPAHPFPVLSNLSLNLLVGLRETSRGTPSLARVKVPVGPHSPRFLRLGNSLDFVALEDVISHNLDLLFADCEIESCHTFRVIRNASTERDEEVAEDLLEMIEAELRDRRFAPFVRLELAAGMPSSQQDLLVEELGLDPAVDVWRQDDLLGKGDLLEIAGLDLPGLHDPCHEPIDNIQLRECESTFEAIRKHGAILLQHPFESFSSSVERFLDEASRDEQVLAIKATLYRTSPGTRIVDSLVRAALDGKQVAVTIELKARFDEAANVRWARCLEEAGVHVSYGVLGLKTHCKALLVVRREESKLRRYVHVGTGNYHAGTARAYCDLGLLSCDEELGEDIADLFNALTTGRNLDRTYRKILTAPQVMKESLLAKIRREVAGHSPASPGLIRLKTNALEDSDIVAALYEAGSAGVRVELLVRDTCRLRPGLAGRSENITVTSVVGRFLEHARLYYFRNGGEEEYYIGSADLMKRNLEHRVELLVPIEKPELRAVLREFLEIQLADRQQSWVMQPNGSYRRRWPKAEERCLPCHELMIEAAEQRRRSSGHEAMSPALASAESPGKREEARRPKKRKTRGPEGRRAKTTKMAKKKSKTKSKTKKHVEIGSRRGIESMLRNSYRAQLSMIALAARKANIMISVNGFLLSLLTLSSAYILTTEPLLLIPSTIFLTTCVLAILFAVLAARPEKVGKTKTRLKDFRKERANLLVFEHFGNLTEDDHMLAMLEMMDDKERVYRSMVAHLHFLGKSAKRRFDLLRISYSTFVVGLIASFVSLAAVALAFYL